MSTKSKNLPPRVLTIGGSDSCGSAGIQADLKTFEAHKVFGSSALTVITAQDTVSVQEAQLIPTTFIHKQATTVLDDLGTDALKTGLLGRAEVVQMVAQLIQHYSISNVVVDPVLVNGQGQQFVAADSVQAYQNQLFPLATVITPNVDEAMILSGVDIQTMDDLQQAARKLHQLGTRYILIKGGHLQQGHIVTDVLYDGQHFIMLDAPRLPIDNPHGVGCTFASAIAAGLALGYPVAESVRRAHRYLQAALAGSQNWQLGRGRLPAFHAVKWEDAP